MYQILKKRICFGKEIQKEKNCEKKEEVKKKEKTFQGQNHASKVNVCIFIYLRSRLFEESFFFSGWREMKKIE